MSHAPHPQEQALGLGAPASRIWLRHAFPAGECLSSFPPLFPTERESFPVKISGLYPCRESERCERGTGFCDNGRHSEDTLVSVFETQGQTEKRRKQEKREHRRQSVGCGKARQRIPQPVFWALAGWASSHLHPREESLSCRATRCNSSSAHT